MFLGGGKNTFRSYCWYRMTGASISVWCRTCLSPNMKPKPESVGKDQAAQLKKTKKIVNGPVLPLTKGGLLSVIRRFMNELLFELSGTALLFLILSPLSV